jgi:hypothetical protein
VELLNTLNPDQPYEHDPWEKIERRRNVSVNIHPELGYFQDLPPMSQYFNPTKYVQKLVASYASHVAWTTPHPTDPSMPVVSVKVYFLRHQMPTPVELRAGYSPTSDVRYFWAWFMGEFNRDGELLEPQEPFLYWRLPIVKVSRKFPQDGSVISQSNQPEDGKLLNGVEIHAELGKR